MRWRLALLTGMLIIFSCHTYAQQHATWYGEIAPIIHKNCTPCHRTGEAAPFALLTYEDVAKRADFVKRVTQTRFMPPWKADPHYVTYSNERRLSDEEIAMIADWADNKMPKGKEEEKDNEVFLSGTQYKRKPDLTLVTKHAYHLEGDNKDRFIVYKLPFELPDSMNVEAIEFITSDRKVIHHANYEIDNVPGRDIYSTDEYLDHTEGTGLKYYEQYVPYRSEIAYFGGWIPGSSIESYPEGMGWVMPKRGVVLLTVHYAPVAKDAEVISGVQFFFTKKPIARRVTPLNMGSGGMGQKEIDPYFYIPPDVTKTFRLDVRTTTDQSLMYVWPHMHLLGTEFTAYAIKPNKDTVRLVHIPKWDFNWQEIYWFPKLVHLPKGTVIHIEGTYDNTADNPNNPSSPPILVHEAMRSKDEMLTLVMISIPYKPGDENIVLKRP